jgi:putative transposase
MENYRTGAHSRFDLKYHFVWVTKYRKKVLTGAVGTRVRELVREVCRTNEIEILQGAVSADHVHVLLSCPRQPCCRAKSCSTSREKPLAS